MFNDLSDDLKSAFNLAVDRINDGLCRGDREFSVSPEAPTELTSAIMNAFVKERWSVEFDGIHNMIKFSSNIPKPLDNKPADFRARTGLRPVSEP